MEEGAVCKGLCDRFYPISILDKEVILQVCQEERINSITTIVSDSVVVTVNYVASRMGLTSNSEEYSGTTTNKYEMRQCFIDNGVPSPRFSLVDDSDNQIADLCFPLIVKPTDRSGSKGVEMVLDSAQLEEALRRAQKVSFEHKAIVEDFVPVKEVCVEPISFEGRHIILQITDIVTSGAPFLWN